MLILIQLLIYLFFYQNLRFHKMDVNILPQNSIQDICQDKNGRIWFASWGGVFAYDGLEFKTFRYQINDSNSLINDNVIRLFQDEDGLIWIESLGGLNSVDPDNFNIRRFEYNHLIKNIYHSATHKNAIYISDKNGLHSYDKKNKRWSEFTKYDAYLSSKEHIYIEIRNNEFILINNSTMIIDDLKGNLHVKSIPLVDNVNWKISEIYSKNYLIFFNQNTIYSYNLINRNIFQISLPEKRDFEIIRQIFIDKNSNIFILTDKGLLYVNHDEIEINSGQLHFKKITVYLMENGNKNSIINDNMLSVFQDESDVIWFGSSAGVSQLFPQRKKIHIWASTSNSQAIFSDNMFFSLSEFQNSYFFLSISKLYQYNYLEKTQKIIDLTQLSPKTGDRFYSMYNSRNNISYIGSRYGLYRYNSHNQKLELLSQKMPQSNELFPAFVYTIKEDRYGNLWLGNNKYLIKYNLKTNQFSKFDLDSNVNDLITNISENHKNELLISSNMAGLFIFNTDDEKIMERIYYNPEKQITANIMHSYQSNDSVVWLATLGKGLIKAQKTNHEYRYRHITESEGLTSNHIYSILSVDNEFWLSSINGISRYNIQTNRFKHYSMFDGLPANEFNQNAFLLSANRHLFYGSIDGVVELDPFALNDNPYHGKIYIQSLLIGNTESLDRLINNRLELDSDERNFTIHFASSSYEEAHENIYAYKLANWHQDWIQLGKKRSIDFNNTQYGNYQLMIKTANNDGRWSDCIKTIDITIATPIWLRGWFLVLFFITSLILIVFVVIYLVRKREKEKIEKLKLENAHIKEKLHIREQISRDLHDELSATLSSSGIFLHFLNDAVAKQKDSTAIIQKLNELMNEAKQSILDIVWVVSPRNDSLQSLADRIQLKSRDLCQAKNILCFCEITVSEDSQREYKIDRRMLFLIFKEALMNAVNHSQATEIFIRFEIDNTYFYLELKDNGMGMDLNSKNSQLGGNGLINMKKRAEEIHAELKIESKIGQGTIIKVSSLN